MADDEVPNLQDEATATPQPVKPRPSSVRAEYRSKTDLEEKMVFYQLDSPSNYRSYPKKSSNNYRSRSTLAIVFKLLLYMGSIVGWIFIFQWVYHLIFS